MSKSKIINRTINTKSGPKVIAVGHHVLDMIQIRQDGSIFGILSSHRSIESEDEGIPAVETRNPQFNQIMVAEILSGNFTGSLIEAFEDAIIDEDLVD